MRVTAWRSGRKRKKRVPREGALLLLQSRNRDVFVDRGLANRRLELVGVRIVLPLGLLLGFQLLLLATGLLALPFRKGNLWSTQIHLPGKLKASMTLMHMRKGRIAPALSSIDV